MKPNQELLPISPLSLNQLTRDYWGSYDAAAIAQLAELAQNPCYRQKFYKAPTAGADSFAAYGYIAYGLEITPGSLIFGFYQPAQLTASNASFALARPDLYTVQITDVSLQHKFWDDPISSVFIGNFKPTYQSEITANLGGFPNLLCAPYPVVGSGLFDVEIQECSGVAQRIQFIVGVLEACNGGR